MIKDIIFYRWTKVVLWVIEFILGTVLLFFLGKFAFKFPPYLLGVIFLFIVAYFYYLLAKWVVNYFTTLKLTPFQLTQILEKKSFVEEGWTYQVAKIENWQIFPQQQVINLKGTLFIQHDGLLTLNFFVTCSTNYYENNLTTYLPENVEVKEKSISPYWTLFNSVLLIYFTLFLLVTIPRLIYETEIERKRETLPNQHGGDFHVKFPHHSSKIAGYLRILHTKPFPPEVRKFVEEEIENLSDSIHGKNQEVIEEWLKVIIRFPWYQETQDNQDLNLVQKKLDEQHYGLQKVKDKIIEYLAVNQQAGKTLGKVICLVGPPGVGKTTLARSVAEALGRKFCRISLGGISHEADIRGLRIAYIGATPGSLVQEIKKAGYINPVILLDEIEKITEGSGHNGNPAAALLEVLDPEQNTKFHDHYMRVEVDLSKVMFICSANSLKGLSRPLLDRMEIIHLPAYSAKEKLLIAQQITKKLLKERNLTDGQLTFSEETLKYLISHYTREAGTRQLAKLIEKITAKFIIKWKTGKVESENITREKVKEYLDQSPIGNDNYGTDYQQSGIVNGLAYTETGGEILKIENSLCPGKGELKLTGNLEKTMEESAQVAITYLKINHSLSNYQDIYIHVPYGGIPKDGPSAGMAFTTAILSSLTNQVIPNSLAMTGEITQKGYITPIGGLQEKLAAAQQSGFVKTVLIPKGNESDLKFIPPEIKKSLKIIPVSHYQQAWETIKSEIAAK